MNWKFWFSNQKSKCRDNSWSQAISGKIFYSHELMWIKMKGRKMKIFSLNCRRHHELKILVFQPKIEMSRQLLVTGHFWKNILHDMWIKMKGRRMKIFSLNCCRHHELKILVFQLKIEMSRQFLVTGHLWKNILHDMWIKMKEKKMKIFSINCRRHHELKILVFQPKIEMSRQLLVTGYLWKNILFSRINVN